MRWKLLSSILFCYLSHYLLFLPFHWNRSIEKKEFMLIIEGLLKSSEEEQKHENNRCKWSNCNITKLYNYASILNDMYDKAIIDEQKKSALLSALLSPNRIKILILVYEDITFLCVLKRDGNQNGEHHIVINLQTGLKLMHLYLHLQ